MDDDRLRRAGKDLAGTIEGVFGDVDKDNSIKEGGLAGQLGGEPRNVFGSADRTVAGVSARRSTGSSGSRERSRFSRQRPHRRYRPRIPERPQGKEIIMVSRSSSRRIQLRQQSMRRTELRPQSLGATAQSRRTFARQDNSAIDARRCPTHHPRSYGLA